MHYINQRGLGGTLTNFATIRKSIARLLELEKMDEENQFDHLHKKEALDLRKEIVKLNKFFGGIKTMKDLPDVMFIVDTRKEKIALAEGKKLGIKIVALVDNPNAVNSRLDRYKSMQQNYINRYNHLRTEVESKLAS